MRCLSVDPERPFLLLFRLLHMILRSSRADGSSNTFRWSAMMSLCPCLEWGLFTLFFFQYVFALRVFFSFLWRLLCWSNSFLSFPLCLPSAPLVPSRIIFSSLTESIVPFPSFTGYRPVFISLSITLSRCPLRWVAPCSPFSVTIVSYGTLFLLCSYLISLSFVCLGG